MSAVSDTNIALYHLRDELIDLLPRDTLISVVTEIEMLGFRGISVVEEADIRVLIATMTVVPLDLRVKNETIRLRRVLTLKLADAIVLATAVVTNSELLTNDRDLLAKAGAVVPCRSLAMKPRP